MYYLLQMVLDSNITLKDAGKRMGVSNRHAKQRMAILGFEEISNALKP